MVYGGGPASVIWCWFMGCIGALNYAKREAELISKDAGCFFIGTSIAELVSAYPTSGGLYSASCYLVPRRYRGPVGYVGASSKVGFMKSCLIVGHQSAG